MLKRIAMLAGSAVIALSMLACQQPAGPGGAPAPSKKSGTQLAKVGSEVITLEDFNSKIEKIPPFYKRRVATKKGKLEFLDRLVQEELYYQEAIAKGMDKDPEYLEQLSQIQKSILAGKVKKDLMEAKKEVSSADAKKYYDEHPEEFQTPDQVTVRHILLRTKRGDSPDKEKEVEAKAQQVYNEISGGKITFAAAAEKYSDDKGSAKKGGELPPIRKGLKSKEFDDVAFAMAKENEVSKPFKDRRGWNILQFVKKETAQPKEFDKVESQIQRKLAQNFQKDSMDKFTEELRKKYPVDIKDDLLKDDEGATDEAAPDMPGFPGEGDEGEEGGPVKLQLKPQGDGAAAGAGAAATGAAAPAPAEPEKK